MVYFHKYLLCCLLFFLVFDGFDLFPMKMIICTTNSETSKFLRLVTLSPHNNNYNVWPDPRPDSFGPVSMLEKFDFPSCIIRSFRLKFQDGGPEFDVRIHLISTN